MRRILDKSIRLAKHLYQRPALHTNWSDLLNKDREYWNQKVARADGPRVLIATTVGGLYAMSVVESMLGAALTLRGARVDFLLCDQVLPACLIAEIHRVRNLKQFVEMGPSKEFCSACYAPAATALDALGLTTLRLSEHISSIEQQCIDKVVDSAKTDEIPDFRWNGIAVGEHGLAGALRFFAKGTIDDEPDGPKVLKRYFKAALMTAQATANLLSKAAYDCVVCHHGIYVPQGIIAEAARVKQARVVAWNPTYRKKCFIFSHNETYHHSLMTEPTFAWKEMPWDETKENEIRDYLKSRWRSTRDWVFFGDKYPEEDFDKIAKRYRLDPSLPIIGLLTNVVWDAQLHYPQNAFSSMLEWIIETVEYFKARPELQLVVRVHPAEIKGTAPSRQRVADELKKHFSELPKNVFVIPPSSNVSTYAVMNRCDSVLIYGTKMGVELSAIGVPVIVAGEAWIRNKGLTKDVVSKSHYRELLDNLPSREPMPPEAIQEALKYAYHFFFRRMIPLGMMEPTPMSPPPYTMRADSIRDLEEGHYPGLDTICDGILESKPFIYRPDLFGVD